jgi:hypothetical protein
MAYKVSCVTSLQIYGVIHMDSKTGESVWPNVYILWSQLWRIRSGVCEFVHSLEAMLQSQEHESFGFFFFLKSESSGFQTHFICVTSKEKYFCFNTSYTSFACLGWIKWLTLINWCQRISWTSESNAYSHKWVIVHQFSNKRNKANIVNTFSSNELTHMSHE